MHSDSFSIKNIDCAARKLAKSPHILKYCVCKFCVDINFADGRNLRYLLLIFIFEDHLLSQQVLHVYYDCLKGLIFLDP